MGASIFRRPRLSIWLGLLLATAAVVAAVATSGHWLPALEHRLGVDLRHPLASHAEPQGHHHDAEDKDDHDHDHAAAAKDDHDHGDADHDHDAAAKDDHDHGDADHDHDAAAKDDHDHGDADHDHEKAEHAHGAAAGHQHVESAAVRLSQAAQANVGLQLAKIELRSFERTISVPAIIVGRPGRTNIQIAAPLTGVVTRIWPIEGQTASPGQPLFELRLTHEEVVEGQAEFLKTAEELDVVGREILRLEKAVATGAIPEKTLLERQYERQKLQAMLRSQRQRLLLHGMSPGQVDGILTKHELLSTFLVSVPEQTEEAPAGAAPRLLQVQEIRVENGQHVKAGETLGVLADHAELYIQGKAFEQDSPVLDRAINDDWRVTAVIDPRGKSRQTVPGLKILYVANKVEPESRAFSFFVQLPNTLTHTRETPDGRRFATWQFKPGQRVELAVPVERWADRIVLPISALVQDGAESYVFEENEGHFDRRTVRVEYRDQFSAVIANDGILKPDKNVIIDGAYQVHLAMKNKAGGAPDPHAGHNH